MREIHLRKIRYMPLDQSLKGRDQKIRLMDIYTYTYTWGRDNLYKENDITKKPFLLELNHKNINEKIFISLILTGMRKFAAIRLMQGLRRSYLGGRTGYFYYFYTYTETSTST